MPEQLTQWQLHSPELLPEWFVQTVRKCAASATQDYAVRLLWQRGIRDPDQVNGFLNPGAYQPASPFEFGQEMHWAVERLQQARTNQERVAIWGDFDADGVTATSVLWDGLGQFFTQHRKLVYFIPNRLTESHGLSRQGIDMLQGKGCRLIVTCDTGSTNLDEIEYANSLGMEVIVTDHHTLPRDRPPVVAILNPRSLPADHPLATLSGVAVAYKLVEALYETLPDVPQQPLEQLLDLVAIGLIADLVELKRDCRYLAQRGIEQLQKQSNPLTANRPGVSKLLEFCKRSGDRPTDISFGLGPRINAVSRIQGDAHFCVELLTSQDASLCTTLAEATELANARRKALQREVVQHVTTRLTQLDLSTTSVIVLADDQWQPGVLGLVAGQIAQEYGRPTILLSVEGSGEMGGWGDEGDEGDEGDGEVGRWGEKENLQSTIYNLQSTIPSPLLARGSARSVNSIDLYQLVKGQEHLLHRFGGHPYAAGLSLPVENLPLFTEAINQQLRQTLDVGAIAPVLQVDLVVTVAELGKELFQELKLLEPCGMGNPAPRLLIQNAWFTNVWNKKIQDRSGRKVEYIKTEFELWDDSASKGFPGVWWGNYRDDIPSGRCDAVVELDFNTYVNEAKGKKPHYEIRLIAVRPCQEQPNAVELQAATDKDWVLDWRGLDVAAMKAAEPPRLRASAVQSENPVSHHPLSTSPPLVMRRCPSSWTELQLYFRRAQQNQQPLAIAYPPPTFTPPLDIWQRLVGIAKYLSRTGNTATRQQLLEKLEIGDRALQLGIKTLLPLGFELSYSTSGFQITWHPPAHEADVNQLLSNTLEPFLISIKEEHFRRQYFFQIPLETIRAMVL